MTHEVETVLWISLRTHVRTGRILLLDTCVCPGRGDNPHPFPFSKDPVPSPAYSTSSSPSLCSPFLKKKGLVPPIYKRLLLICLFIEDALVILPHTHAYVLHSSSSVYVLSVITHTHTHGVYTSKEEMKRGSGGAKEGAGRSCENARAQFWGHRR